MIDIQTKIHDKFSIEFKVGFSGREDVKDEHFDVNTWIFVPNGLDINKNTYSKDRFYTDMKSNVRLITPSFALKDIVGEEAVPYRNLKQAVTDVVADPSPAHRSEFEFQLKLFGSIFKRFSICVSTSAFPPLGRPAVRAIARSSIASRITRSRCAAA